MNKKNVFFQTLSFMFYLKIQVNWDQINWMFFCFFLLLCQEMSNRMRKIASTDSKMRGWDGSSNRPDGAKYERQHPENEVGKPAPLFPHNPDRDTEVELWRETGSSRGLTTTVPRTLSGLTMLLMLCSEKMTLVSRNTEAEGGRFLTSTALDNIFSALS